MSDTAKMEIKPRTLRALACDIEDCHSPQSWADYCRAAAAMLETQAARIADLEAALRQISDQACDTFHINPEGGANIVVEGLDRFAFESDVVALVNIARAALRGGKDEPRKD